MKVKSLSRFRLFATSWTAAYQAPPSMGFSRQEYWSGLPFPSAGDLPDPGIEPRSPTLQADALTSEPPGKPSLRLNYRPQTPTNFLADSLLLCANSKQAWSYLEYTVSDWHRHNGLEKTQISILLIPELLERFWILHHQRTGSSKEISIPGRQYLHTE